MPFKLLKQVVAHLLEKSKCPFCEIGFGEETIFSLASSFSAENGSFAGLFLLLCPKCHASAFSLVEATNVTDRIKKEEIRISTRTTPTGISVDEILDMHNFLKNWEGNLEELFK